MINVYLLLDYYNVLFYWGRDGCEFQTVSKMYLGSLLQIKRHFQIGIKWICSLSDNLWEHMILFIANK